MYVCHDRYMVDSEKMGHEIWVNALASGLPLPSSSEEIVVPPVPIWGHLAQCLLRIGPRNLTPEEDSSWPSSTQTTPTSFKIIKVNMT